MLLMLITITLSIVYVLMLFWGIVKCKIDWGSTKADIYAVVVIVGLTDTKISSHQDVTEFPQQNWLHLHVSISRLQGLTALIT